MYKTIRRITSRIMVATILIGFFSMYGINCVSADGPYEGRTALDDTLPDKAGRYYLTKDIHITSTWSVPEGEVDLLLDGNSIIMDVDNDVISIGVGSTLNIDDHGSGSIKHEGGSNISDGIVVKGGTLNLYGGFVTENFRGIRVEYGSANIGTGSYAPMIWKNSCGIYAEGGSVTINNVLSTENESYGIAAKGSNPIVINSGDFRDKFEGKDEDLKKIVIRGGSYSQNAYESIKDLRLVEPGYKIDDPDSDSYPKTVVEGSGYHNVYTPVKYEDQKIVKMKKNKESALVGEEVTIVVEFIKDDYGIKEFNLRTETQEKKPISFETKDYKSFTFIMPDEPVRAEIVVAKCKKISFDLIHANVKMDRFYSFPGEEVTFTLEPESAEYEQCYIFSPGIDELTEVDEGRYTFTMPDHDVKITSHYMKKDHVHDGKTFFSWDQTFMPLQPGSYALTKDVSIDNEVWETYGDFDLCLNGHTIKLVKYGIIVTDGTTFNLYDCKGNGTIDGNRVNQIGVNRGTVHMYGGTITNSRDGFVERTGSNLYIHKGTIDAENAFSLRSGGNLTIGDENDTGPSEIYIKGRVETASNLSDIKLYSGCYDEVAHRYLVYYGDDKFIAREGYGFIESGRSDEYTYMIGNKIPYNITINESENGSVSCDRETAMMGTTVSLKVKPDVGYELKSLTVTDAEGNNIEIKDDQFIMPGKDVTVNATFKLAEYSITYELDDGVLPEGSPTKYNVNSEITLPTPTKEHFVFKGWTGTDTPNPRTTVTIPKGSSGDREYTANWETEKFTVTFVDDDGKTVLQKTQVEYGETPKYNGTDPTKDPTAEYTYTFDGWDPEIAAVTRNETYTATYTATKNKYTITFVDEDGKELQSSEVEYGKTPSYTGEEPSKTADAQYTYAFAGWDPEITSVTGDTTYKAKFTKTINKYTVIWKNYDGTELEKDVDVEYGAIPSYDKETLPVKPKEGEKKYTFSGWTPEVSSVEEDAEYTATFVESSATYDVIWLNNDEDVSKPVRDKKENITMEQINAVLAEIGTPTPAVADSHYTYTFLNWNTRTVDGVLQYIATFSQKPVIYTVTWVDGDGKTLKTDSVAYLSTPSYSGAEPTKAADAENTYTFDGWGRGNPHPTNGDTTYTAQFSSVKNKYRITFVDGDGNTLRTDEFEYGTTPEYKGETPTKSPIEGYVYEFKGWDPEIVSVTGNATYKATFEKRSNKVTVTFVNYDGETVLATVETIYGEIPEYDGPVPTKTVEGDSYTYEFKGWEPELGPVTRPTTYTAQYNAIPKQYKVSFDLNGADYGYAPETMVTYDTSIPEPLDPMKEGFEFAGWFTKDDTKWKFDTPIKGEVKLIAQWNVIVEEPDEKGNKLEGQTISNKYNEKPLIIKTNNGVIYIPAGYTEDVTVPAISNKDNVVRISQDLMSQLDLSSKEMTWIYLDVEYTKSINENLTSEDSKQGYTQVSNSGFMADVRKFILKDKKETEIKDYKYPGSLTVNIDLKGMGISLPEASADKIRTFYAGHNYKGTSVEYLQMGLSSDGKTANISVSTLSPFDIVYRDVKKVSPSTPSYVAPKTGIE